MSLAAQQAVHAADQQYGVPDAVSFPIAQVESSMNPAANVKDSNGAYSTGLFQLNQKGQGNGYTVSQLKNPTLNANIGVQNEVKAYKASQKLGLSGYQQVAYVASHSGHPGYSGTLPQSYSQALQKAYQQYDGGGNVNQTQTQSTPTNGGGGFLSSVVSQNGVTWKTLAVDGVFAVIGIGLLLKVL